MDWGEPVSIHDEADRFRIANDRLADMVRPLSPVSAVNFICECADPSCFGSNEMTLADFEQRRESGGPPIIGPNCRELGGPGR